MNHYRIIKFAEWDNGIYFTALHHHIIDNGKREIKAESQVIEYSSGINQLTATGTNFFTPKQFSHKCSKPQDIQR